MDSRAISKACSRLVIARKAVVALNSSNTFDEFSANWYGFLVAAKNVYTILEQGAKVSPQSRQWFGSKNAQRRADPLLQYLYQARDDDEHGLGNVLEHVPGRLAIGRNKLGFSEEMSFTGSISAAYGGPDQTSLNVQSLDGKPVFVDYTPSHAKLIRVHGRGKRVYDPPEEHLGTKLASNLPIPVATVALVYLTALVDEAAGLPSP
jgi:hypothetical protein